MKYFKNVAFIFCCLFFTTNLLFAQSATPINNNIVREFSEVIKNNGVTRTFKVKITENQFPDITNTNSHYELHMVVQSPIIVNKDTPIFYQVHGGGWNSKNNNIIPKGTLPTYSDFLCNTLGVIYVGLAYSCMENPGFYEPVIDNNRKTASFAQAMEELKYQIQVFENDIMDHYINDANHYNTNALRIGIGGGSAGTTLSSKLSQSYNPRKRVKVYIGNEGMYDLQASYHRGETDMGASSTYSDNSNFPVIRLNQGTYTPWRDDFANFGLGSIPLRNKNSASFQLGRTIKFAPQTLLFHGVQDYQCDPKQSINFAKRTRNQKSNFLEGAKAYCKEVRYLNINHTCISKDYPEVYKYSVNEIAVHINEHLLKKSLGQNVLDDINRAVENNLLSKFYVIDNQNTIKNRINRAGEDWFTNKKGDKDIIKFDKLNKTCTVRIDNNPEYFAYEIVLVDNPQKLRGNFKANKQSTYKAIPSGSRPPAFNKVFAIKLYNNNSNHPDRYFFMTIKGDIVEHANQNKDNFGKHSYKAVYYTHPNPPVANTRINQTSNELSISNDLPKADVRLYPNPTKNDLFITNVEDNILYSIYSLNGQSIVKNRKIVQGAIDVSKLESGIYVIQLENGVSLKFIKL